MNTDISSRAAAAPPLARATSAVPLLSATRDVWVRAALSAPLELLDDHCQCELKAASNALALVGRNPEHDDLVKAMSALSKEEMVHYRIVRKQLLDRGGKVTRPLANPYVKGLGRERLGGGFSLLDDLVVAALVEARSCERFVALASGLERFTELPVERREELASLYARLAQSESGHARLFVELAEGVFEPALVARELERRAGIEAKVLEEIPVTARMHGGHGSGG